VATYCESMMRTRVTFEAQQKFYASSILLAAAVGYKYILKFAKYKLALDMDLPYAFQFLFWLIMLPGIILCR
jgi:hypothetical protein